MTSKKELQRQIEEPCPTPTVSGLPTWTILRFIFIILSVATGLVLLYKLRGLILLLVLAIFFAYLIAPLVNYLSKPFSRRDRKHVLPRTAAIVIVYLSLFGLLAGSIYLLLPMLSQQLTDIIYQAPQYLASLQAKVAGLKSIYQTYQIPPSLQSAFNNTVMRINEGVGDYLRNALTEVMRLLVYLPWLILVPILAFFFLKDADSFWRAMVSSLPQGPMRWKGADFLRDLSTTLATYVRAQLIACLLVGVVCSIGFSIIGVPFALVLGIAAGLMEFIPVVGPLIIAVLTTSITMFNSSHQALAVFLFLAILRIAQDYFIYPHIIGKSIDIKPLAIILAVLCGAELGGFIGVFLSVPVIAILAVCYRHWLEYRGSRGIVEDLLKPVEKPANNCE
jgi:predicted PurR-regulated permease PerM